MRLVIFDPVPAGHDYLTRMYFGPLRSYGAANGRPVDLADSLENCKNCTVLALADYLNSEVVDMLRNNNCGVIGFSVTDSSYISQACREGRHLKNIDLMFMLTGIQKTNTGFELTVDKDFNISLQERRYLPDEDWQVFFEMKQAGRLQSLPYVHWDRQPSVSLRPYNERAKRVLIRGGGHSRRIILALFLFRQKLLSPHSGFVLWPYFASHMNPQFRYCEDCQQHFRTNGKFVYEADRPARSCNNEPGWDDFSDLGKWNNRCPASLMHMAEVFERRWGQYDKWEFARMLNAGWLPQHQHLDMLSREMFTSDFKWLFSIYAPQRFWDGALAGTVNLLPHRTNDQDYFPAMEEHINYLTFKDDFSNLSEAMAGAEGEWNVISSMTEALYNQWIKPSHHPTNSNLLKHILDTIERYAPA